MARRSIEDASGLSAGEVTHKRFSTLPADATVAEVRAWFAASSHRRMAFIADEGRYVGSLTPSDLGNAVDADRLASEIAHRGPTIAPNAPARLGHELALQTEARRVPVVDHDGRLLGVVSVTDDLAAFCGAI